MPTVTLARPEPKDDSVTPEISSFGAAMELKRQDCSRFDLGGHSLIFKGKYDRFRQGMQARCYETAGEFFCFQANRL